MKHIYRSTHRNYDSKQLFQGNLKPKFFIFLKDIIPFEDYFKLNVCLAMYHVNRTSELHHVNIFRGHRGTEHGKAITKNNNVQNNTTLPFS